MLTEEIATKWILGASYSADRSIYHRYEVLKGLAQFMIRQGISAFCPKTADLPKIHWHTYSPYIFSRQEIAKLFEAIDTYKESPYSNSHKRHLVMPLIFRLLYSCGMRVSEVISLKVDDVDFENGIITVTESKSGTARYVPMLDEIKKLLQNYVIQQHPQTFLFPSRDGGKYHDKTIYGFFRQILEIIGIPHQGRGKGPRVHDFRHTFAVHSLLQAQKRGIPFSACLPRISACLGHHTLNATMHYLHWTEEYYPEIVQKLQNSFGTIIPEGVQNHEED